MRASVAATGSSTAAALPQCPHGLPVWQAIDLEAGIATGTRPLEPPQAVSGLRAARPIDADLPIAGVAAVHPTLCLDDNVARKIIAVLRLWWLFLWLLCLVRIARTSLHRAADEQGAEAARAGRSTIEGRVRGLFPEHILAAVFGDDVALPVGNGVGHGRTLARDLARARKRSEFGSSGRIETLFAIGPLLGPRLR